MIGNNNTKKLHADGCRAIGMMKEEHKEHHLSDEELKKYSSCGWCHEPVGDAIDFEESLNTIIQDEVCTDPCLRKRLINLGCQCGSHLGTVRMYPHHAGILVDGREGTWWVYFKCYECGHTSSFKLLPETFDQNMASEEVD